MSPQIRAGLLASITTAGLVLLTLALLTGGPGAARAKSSQGASGAAAPPPAGALDDARPGVPATASVTPPACGPGSNYVIATATATIVPGTTDTGNHCDDCVTGISLPFAYNLYGVSYNTADLSSNGNLQFGSVSNRYINECLPYTIMSAAILPFWDDLRTDSGTGCSAYTSGCGIYSSVTGSAPNRVFNIEWRAMQRLSSAPVHFEIRLYEGQDAFDIVYDTVGDGGSSATIGVQNQGGSAYTQVSCNSGGISTGELMQYAESPCGSPTPTATGTPPSATPTVPPTASPTCQPAGAWSQRAVYLVPIMDEAVVALGGKLYSFGGYTAGGPTAYASSYNPATDTWTAIAALPEARQRPSATTDGTYIYILGGWNSGYLPTNTIWRYDPASNAYTGSLNSFSIATASQAAAYIGGNIYKIGGCTGPSGSCTSYTNVVEKYNVAGNSWTMAASYPLAVKYLTANVIGAYIYTTGNSSENPYDQVKTFRYDPAAAAWDDNSIPDLPLPRWGAASGVLNGRLILAGGMVDVITSNTAIAWAPGDAGWTSLPPMTYQVRRLAGDVVPDGFHAVGGDASIGFQTTNYNQRYLETGGCGTATPAPSTPTVTATTPPPTSTVGPPTLTVVPPTSTNVAPTASPTGLPATGTPVPPSSTALPATATSVPPSSTAQAATPSPPPPSATPCLLSFSDVHPVDYFYGAVQYLACHGVVSGYADGTFRPYANTTRAQMVKIVVLGFARPIQTPANGAYTFADVLPSHPFFVVIETAAALDIVSGYACGGPGEPCDSANRPYFRPYASVTRGQLAKIDVVAAGWALRNPPTPSFTDVASGSAFYEFVETAVCHGVISGYADGTFRPGANATRGQIAKIVYLSITAGGPCSGAGPGR